jgi:predicted N-acyltransferase
MAVLAASVSTYLDSIPTPHGTVHVANRQQVEQCLAWRSALTHTRKDYRYYAIVEDTILQGFDYRYFIVEDPAAAGQVIGIQPFFIHAQDLLGGAEGFARRAVGGVRRFLPRFLTMRTLMIGCAAGEGHLDRRDDEQARQVVAALHEALKVYARRARVSLVVFKEFMHDYRGPMDRLRLNGYTRVPSLPATRLSIDYADFDDYLAKALSKSARRDLRRKFKKADEAAEPITMEVVTDLTPYLDEAYPLYLQVFERSSLRFEKLTKEYFRRVGQEMPDRAKFFLWRQKGKLVAFNYGLAHGDELWDEYLGLDYSVALDLHLYFLTLRDVIAWAIQNGFKWYCSGGQGFEPKLHLRCTLMPVDLYVRHRWLIANMIMRRVLPLLEPTRNDPAIQKFPNYADVWGHPTTGAK